MLAVALWIKLARKKSFWNPNTKPWRRMVTTSGILVRNKREKGKRNNEGITFEWERTNLNKFTYSTSCNSEELFAEFGNAIICVFSGWYPFVEFCVNVAKYSGKSVKLHNWVQYLMTFFCDCLTLLVCSLAGVLTNTEADTQTHTEGNWASGSLVHRDEDCVHRHTDIQVPKNTHRDIYIYTYWRAHRHIDTQKGQVSFGCSREWGLCANT